MNPLRPTLKWDAAPEDVTKAWQLRQLRKFLATNVLPHSVHYRRLFHNAGFNPKDLHSWEDWNRLPFTSKTDLISEPGEPSRARDFLLQPDVNALRHRPGIILRALLQGTEKVSKMIESEFRPLMLTSTTGRSSEPVSFFFSRYDLRNLETAGNRIMQIGGSSREYRHVNLFPYAPHLAFWQAHYAGTGFGTFCLSSGGGKTLGTAGNITIIDRTEPEVIIGMPTFLYHLFTEALECGRCWKRVKLVVLGGEKVPPGMRKKLQDLMAELGSPGAKVLSIYGFTEAKMAFAECPSASGVEGTGFHVPADLAYFEVIDPTTGRPVAAGEPGELVFTPLDSRGSVVLRYRTGDLIDGGMVHEPCPHCGRIMPRLLGNISRVSEICNLKLDKIKGTLVDFNQLERMLDGMEGLQAWQIELRKDHDDPLERDLLLVHATALPTLSEAFMRHRIQDHFARNLEISPNEILFHDLGTLREQLGVGRLLKEEKIADHRPKVGLALSS